MMAERELDNRLNNFVDANKDHAKRRNLPEWFGEVTAFTRYYFEYIKDKYPNEVPEALEIPRDLPVARANRWLIEILEDLSPIDTQMYNNNELHWSPGARFDVLARAGRQIRQQKDYKAIFQFGSIITAARESGNLSPSTAAVLNVDLATLYLLACYPDKFLVGIKDGEQWKNVKLPENYIDRLEQSLHLASQYLTNIGAIGRREVVLIPDKPISPHESINLPRPARSVEELLEDAYFKQRYIVPPEGAEIRFRKAGDLQKMLLMHSGDKILARIITTRGDALVTLDNNTANWTSPDSNLPNIPKESIWVNILAEVYHDMVTADEVSTTMFKKLKQPHSKNKEEFFLEETLEVVYIPRKVKVGENTEPRLPYNGTPRPIRPHRVTGHLRTANMTAAQRLNILSLEEELGIHILRFVPAGKTFVRPHVSPSEAREKFSTLPIFIKRRIETTLRQDFNRLSQ